MEALVKAIMADWWGGQDVPATCEVQVEVKFRMCVVSESESAFLPVIKSCQLSTEIR